MLFFLHSHFHFVNNRVTRTFTTTLELFGTFRTFSHCGRFCFQILVLCSSSMGQLASQKVTAVYPVADQLSSPFSNRVFLPVSWKRKKWGHPRTGRQQHVISHKMESKTFDGAAGILNDPSGDVHHTGTRVDVEVIVYVATCWSKW